MKNRILLPALCAGLIGASAFAAPARHHHPRPAPRSATHQTPPATERLAPPLTGDERIYQVLNRLTFGPRPGDFERVRAMGITAFLDQQLHPDTIPDNTANVLAGLHTLDLPPQDLWAAQAFNVRRLIPKTADGKPDLKTAMEAPVAFTDEDIQRQTAKMLTVPELQFAKVARAVESNRQLLEVMTDFWTNHFNIDVRKGFCRTMKVVDDRDVVRKYALGHFRDLLEASAKSPAMLEYLDNAESIGQPRLKLRMGKDGKPLPVRSAPVTDRLNENYARELMELHTLGVDGGYTQKDVIEVARCFTGWGIDRKTGEFRFYPQRHDDGEKVVLGVKIPAGGGIEDGETVLDILAGSKATARHIAYELCQRFIADDPPRSAVDRAASAFQSSDGDIAEAVRAIVASPEFYSRAAYRSKIKSPFEYAVSCVRALDAHIQAPEEVPAPSPLRGANLMVTVPAPANPRITLASSGKRPETTRSIMYGGLAGQIDRMGEPLFQYQPPTGYPENSKEWLGAGALLSRMNFAIALARGQLPEVIGPMDSLRERSAGSLAGIVNIAEEDILQGNAHPSTREALLGQANAEGPKSADPALIAALALGSPEFQRR